MEGKYIKPVVTGIPTINSNSNLSENNKKNIQFNEIFQTAVKEIKFSKHAESRIAERSIDVSADVKEKVSQAIDVASEKGIKDSLILFNDMAFVVNVNSRTVITAIDKEDMQSRVFTNIDGAVCI